MKFDLKVLNNNFDELEKRIKNFAKTEAFVGYGKSQGIHETSGMYYVDLIALLSAGYSGHNLPARPIFKYAMNDYDINKSILQKDLSNYFSRISSKKAPISTEKIAEHWAEDFGGYVLRIFGETPPLASNAVSTIKQKGKNSPLEDTGDLRDHLGYSINGGATKLINTIG